MLFYLYHAILRLPSGYCRQPVFDLSNKLNIFSVFIII